MQEVEISSKLELLEYLSEQTIEVEWIVTSDIGPEWVGSTTEVSFYLGDLRVKENAYIQKLITALKEKVGIPKSGGDRIVSGEAVITAIDQELNVKFNWSSCFPYMDPDLDGKGEVRLIA